MKVTIITFCLIGAVFANPISFNALLDSTELDSNSTESASVSQSSENSTSEQSSEESTSNQSSESESLESTSEDTTSEESDSQSDESDGSDSMPETRDNSMSSEENLRKSWVQVYNVMQDLSDEDNSSTEVKGQGEQLSTQQPTHTSTIFKQEVNTTQLNQPLVDSPTSSSESTENSEATAAPSASTSESSSSESNETSESSESTEDSTASDSAEVQKMKASDCVNGTQSCESEEYFFHDIGDDAHHGVDNLMVPDDDERELTLRR
nr:PREDICTED: osteocalcin 2-like [Paralichthys olivaceus]